MMMIRSTPFASRLVATSPSRWFYTCTYTTTKPHSKQHTMKEVESSSAGAESGNGSVSCSSQHHPHPPFYAASIPLAQGNSDEQWRYVDLVHPHIAEFADLF